MGWNKIFTEKREDCEEKAFATQKRRADMGKKAVVLGGGGSRGSYQVGVWKALRELDFDYKIVTGTSVGALNGALMVQNDYELAQKMWQKLKTRDVMDVAVTDKIEGRKDLTSKVSAFISEIVKNGGADFSFVKAYARQHNIGVGLQIKPAKQRLYIIFIIRRLLIFAPQHKAGFGNIRGYNIRRGA